MVNAFFGGGGGAGSFIIFSINSTILYEKPKEPYDDIEIPPMLPEKPFPMIKGDYCAKYYTPANQTNALIYD